MTNAPPSINPADLFSMTGMVKLALRKGLQYTDDMLPAKVLAYDRTTNRAQVQILIAMVTTDNKIVDRNQIASVPVLQLGGGGFVISFPLAEGSLGWIKANDRDISLFKKNYQNARPNTGRFHSFEDGVFIPDTMLSGVTIASEDASNAVFQNSAGTVKVSLWSSFMKLLGRVGIGGSPDTNAILDVQSTTQASIPWPRMTTSQRDAIPSPQGGMAVWLTDVTPDRLSTYSSNTASWS